MLLILDRVQYCGKITVALGKDFSELTFFPRRTVDLFFDFRCYLGELGFLSHEPRHMRFACLFIFQYMFALGAVLHQSRVQRISAQDSLNERSLFGIFSVLQSLQAVKDPT